MSKKTYNAETCSLRRTARRLARTKAWRERQRLGTLLTEIREWCAAADEALDLRNWTAATKGMAEVIRYARTMQAELEKPSSPSEKLRDAEPLTGAPATDSKHED